MFTYKSEILVDIIVNRTNIESCVMPTLETILEMRKMRKTQGSLLLQE